METQRDEWSLRRPTNAVIVGGLWVAGVVATLMEGLSWKASAIAGGTGVLFGLLYSPRRFGRRLLAFTVVIFGMSAAGVTWGHGQHMGIDMLLDLQFLAIALTFALLVGAIRRRRSLAPSRITGDAAAEEVDGAVARD